VSEFGAEGDDPPVQAARVSLGAVGIMTAMRLRLQPAYQLRKREWCSHIDDCLENFEELAARHRHIDFYWYPRRDEAKIRIMDLAEDEPDMLSFARLVAEEVGWSNEIIANVRELRFEEMEYALPAAAGPACFAEVRGRVKERHRQRVAWRVLYRTVAPDDAFLSPHYDRQSVTISLHHNAGLPYWDYFGDIEPIFRAHGGRPHWGKKHTLTAAELRPLYPAWGDFSAVRRRMDPCGVFMTPAMRDLLGIS
jgi:FAD/FMN-containing dehydrogenase